MTAVGTAGSSTVIDRTMIVSSICWICGDMADPPAGLQHQCGPDGEYLSNTATQYPVNFVGGSRASYTDALLFLKGGPR